MLLVLSWVGLLSYHTLDGLIHIPLLAAPVVGGGHSPVAGAPALVVRAARQPLLAPVARMLDQRIRAATMTDHPGHHRVGQEMSRG